MFQVNRNKHSLPPYPHNHLYCLRDREICSYRFSWQPILTWPSCFLAFTGSQEKWEKFTTMPISWSTYSSSQIAIVADDENIEYQFWDLCQRIGDWMSHVHYQDVSSSEATLTSPCRSCCTASPPWCYCTCSCFCFSAPSVIVWIPGGRGTETDWFGTRSLGRAFWYIDPLYSIHMQSQHYMFSSFRALVWFEFQVVIPLRKVILRCGCCCISSSRSNTVLSLYSLRRPDSISTCRVWSCQTQGFVRSGICLSLIAATHILVTFCYEAHRSIGLCHTILLLDQESSVQWYS